MRKKGFMTIGYGNMNVNDFIQILVKNRVNCIVDVRTTPYSKYNVSFNKEEFRDRLAEKNISYFWYGNKLGGRYDRISMCNEQGVVDYIKVSDSEKFKEGIKELEKLCCSRNVCVMCSEREPIKCHRFLLISRALKEYNIYHIMPDNTLVKNSVLEQILFDMYAGLNQLSLFDNDANESLEKKAYRMHGFKTAYISEKVKELLASGITEDVPEKVKIYCIGCEGKNAEEFFGLLKEYKVRRVIDIRKKREGLQSFANYPDIAYYLKLNCIEYERINGLIPPDWMCYGYEQRDIKKYTSWISNSIIHLLSEDLEGTCFLGESEDYKSCYRQIILKELKKHNKNIRVRHLR